MSRFRVEAEFVSADQPTGNQIAVLLQLLNIHNGDVFARSSGWRATVFLSMQPSPADAGFSAGQIMREANKAAGMPDATMTDIHIHRVGGRYMMNPPGDSPDSGLS